MKIRCYIVLHSSSFIPEHKPSGWYIYDRLAGKIHDGPYPEAGDALSAAKALNEQYEQEQKLKRRQTGGDAPKPSF